MKNNGFPVCPYCKRKLNFAKCWKIHTRTEYLCENCHHKSDVKLPINIVKRAVVTVLISVGLLLIFSIINTIKIWQILLVILPFVFFYLSVPKSIILLKKDKESKEDKEENEYIKRYEKVIDDDNYEEYDDTTTEKTKMMPQKKIEDKITETEENKEESFTDLFNKIVNDEKI